MNIRLDLQFDGTDFHGWQIQPKNRTVQGALKEAICKVTGEDIVPQGCGRTDSGVHAMGYVASFKTDSLMPAERMSHALNTHLPHDIVCYNAQKMPEDFCAARSAKGKTYRYTIDNNRFCDVFLQRFAWHYKYPIDIEKMTDAAIYFCGTHDFKGFAASGYSVKTTVRTITGLNIKEHNGIITIDVTGNGFLYNMVRIIVGTLVWVGQGKIMPSDITDIILSKERSRAGITAPANGLCLKEVFY